MQRYNYELEYLIDDVKEEHNYLSETKKEVLNNVKGNYPQLCTYESEWIYFDETGYTPGEPVEIEYQTVEGTNCIVENAIPYKYKSAILKGSTLVNLIHVSNFTYDSGGKKYTQSFAVKPGTKYLLRMTLSNKNAYLTSSKDIVAIRLCHAGDTSINFFYTNIAVSNLTTESINTQFITNSSTSYVDFTIYNQYPSMVNAILIEYEDGMENWDIPYFESMQSVKMPVLMTTGKNIVGNLEKGSIGTNGEDVNNANDSIFTRTGFILLKKDTTYSFSLNGTKRSFQLYLYDLNKNFIKRVGMKNEYTPEVNCYIRLFQEDNINNALYQVEEGTIATPYEPFKSNILTVNEEVKLRGIGDVQDTLNCLTGELIESIGEGILNGSEEWVFNAPKEQPNHWCFHNYQKLADEKLLISDRFPQSDIDGDRESIRGGGDFIFVYISKEKVEGNVNSFKQWLSQNPIKYQYRKSEKSVKTVDLTPISYPFEGYNKFTTSSDTIPPSMKLEIPVVSTGEQTLQEIND